MASLRAQLTGEPDPAEAAAVPSVSAEMHALEEPAPERAVSPSGEEEEKGKFGVLAFAAVMGAFWAGAASAYLWGFFGAQGLFRLDAQMLAFAVTITFLPPFLFIASGFAFARAQTMSDTARRLAAVSERLTMADESAVQSAQRLGRAVRRELDALSSGLDAAFGRMRALETALEDRVAQLEDATARAGVKAENIAQRLHAEREGIEDLAAKIDETSARAAEMLAGKSAQLKAMLESAGGELKSAGHTLEVQSTQFREAAEKAAAAPHAAAVELDRQAKVIEAAADAAVARAEFVLARQERQRTAMNELLAALKEDASAFDTVLERQRNAAEKAASALTGQALKLDELADQGFRRIDAAMNEAAARGAQIASSFGRDADYVRENTQAAETAIAKLIESLREAAASAYDHVLDAQSKGAVHMEAALIAETKRRDELADQGARRIDAAMNEAAARGAQIALNFGKDADRVRENTQTAEAAIAKLVEKLREAAASAYDHVLDAQRKGSVNMEAALAAETIRLDELADQGARRLESAMVAAAARGTEVASSFGKDAERVKETAESAMAAIVRVVEALREGATSAQLLIADSTTDAQRRAKEFVGEAMGECNHLLRAASSVAEEAEKARAALAKAVQDAERHMVALPGIAAQEAERIRDMVRIETEQMLDISARTVATLQTRATRRTGQTEAPAPAPDPNEADSMGDSLRGLARRITSPRRRAEDRPRGSYELSAVLAAVDMRDAKPGLKPGAASALSALQAALSDLAGDLEELAGETADPALWRRYLDGDRGVFVRQIAASIGPESINRITGLYRDNPRFHESADSYLEEFEAMLVRAREGDRDGFLASTLLTADTGKIYLAIAYALGRLA